MTAPELHSGEPSVVVVGRRILIADDDCEMRRWVRAVLELKGARVEEAASGWELLSCLAAAPFDLVISDVRMPMPNGLGVLSMARAAGVTTPFLVITAFASAELGERVHGFEYAALLDKPFDEHDLLERAQHVMWRRAMSDREAKHVVR